MASSNVSGTIQKLDITCYTVVSSSMILVSRFKLKFVPTCIIVPHTWIVPSNDEASYQVGKRERQ